MDLSAIPTLISSLKTVSEIATAIVSMKGTSEVQAKIIEMQSALLAAQSSALSATTAQFELQQHVRELEAQLKGMNDWESQRSRYALVSPWHGPAQAYALKKSHAQGEQPHLLCAHCFEASKRVVLNPVKTKDAWILLACPSCKATMETGYRGLGSHKYAEDYLDSQQS